MSAPLYVVPSPDGADASFSFADLPRPVRAAIAHHYAAARSLVHVARFALRDGNAARLAECMRLVAHHRGWIKLARTTARDTDHALRSFDRAVRKLGRLIDGVARGDSERAARAALASLDRASDAPEIRGNDDARESAWATVSALRARLADAIEIGRSVRIDARHVEIAALRVQAREEARARPY